MSERNWTKYWKILLKGTKKERLGSESLRKKLEKEFVRLQGIR